jgi:hypothetical protein
MKIKNLLWLLSLVAILFSCEEKEESLSTEKEILSFKLEEFDPVLEGEIVYNSISIIVEPTVDVTALTPTIEVSEKATIIPESGTTLDFTDLVYYTVQAEDLTHESYTVRIYDTALYIYPYNNNYLHIGERVDVPCKNTINYSRENCVTLISDDGEEWIPIYSSVNDFSVFFWVPNKITPGNFSLKLELGDRTYIHDETYEIGTMDPFIDSLNFYELNLADTLIIYGRNFDSNQISNFIRFEADSSMYTSYILEQVTEPNCIKCLLPDSGTFYIGMDYQVEEIDFPFWISHHKALTITE